MSNSNIKTTDLVERLRERLNCNKKTLSILLSVTQNTLSNNIEKPWAEVKDCKFGKNLLSLLYVVETLSKDSSLDSSTINKVIVTPRYMLEDGNIIDVITGIRIDLPNELLIEVADKSLSYLREKYNKDKRPDKNSVYFKAAAM